MKAATIFPHSMKCNQLSSISSEQNSSVLSLVKRLVGFYFNLTCETRNVWIDFVSTIVSVSDSLSENFIMYAQIHWREKEFRFSVYFLNFPVH